MMQRIVLIREDKLGVGEGGDLVDEAGDFLAYNVSKRPFL
jgi:hypothetical protein